MISPYEYIVSKLSRHGVYINIIVCQRSFIYKIELHPNAIILIEYDINILTFEMQFQLSKNEQIKNQFVRFSFSENNGFEFNLNCSFLI